MPVIQDMADVADRIAGKISKVLAHPRRDHARPSWRLDDDAMDELHKGLFVVLLGAAWRHGVESAIDGALLGRFYERYADHAVNAGRHMYFLVTGEQLHLTRHLRADHDLRGHDRRAFDAAQHHDHGDLGGGIPQLSRRVTWSPSDHCAAIRTDTASVSGRYIN